jgi:threonine dehydrogenase-like Zn-dependent dehydrogenase
VKAVCFQSVETVAIKSIADPAIESVGDAIVQVEAAGLCGSDLHAYFGRETGLDPGTAMGHEFVGRVIQVGPAVRGLSVGDRVCSPFTTSCGECFYCHSGLSSRCLKGQLFGWREQGVGLHGGQSEQVRVPLADGTLVKVPDGMTNETALLLGDNLSTGYFGASLALDPEHVATDVVAVIGCGTVGLLGIAAARRLGARNCIAIDPNVARLRIAEYLGAIVFEGAGEALAAISASTEGRGADAVMEFVGLPDAQRLAYQVIRPGGRMAAIGCHCAEHFAFTPAQAYDKNLTYRTGRCPARSIMDRLARELVADPLDLSWCVTHRFGLDDAVAAYETFAHRKDGCVKAVLEL